MCTVDVGTCGYWQTVQDLGRVQSSAVGTQGAAVLVLLEKGWETAFLCWEV